MSMMERPTTNGDADLEGPRSLFREGRQTDHNSPLAVVLPGSDALAARTELTGGACLACRSQSPLLSLQGRY